MNTSNPAYEAALKKFETNQLPDFIAALEELICLRTEIQSAVPVTDAPITFFYQEIINLLSDFKLKLEYQIEYNTEQDHSLVIELLHKINRLSSSRLALLDNTLADLLRRDGPTDKARLTITKARDLLKTTSLFCFDLADEDANPILNDSKFTSCHRSLYDWTRDFRSTEKLRLFELKQVIGQLSDITDI